MVIDTTYVHAIQAKAIDDRDKLIHNNKEVINQDSLSLWKQGSLASHELAYKINSPAVRESFMYLTIVIYEMTERIEQINKSLDNVKPEYNYSC